MTTSNGDERPRSQPGRVVVHGDGTASCRVRIPLGHPASRFYEPDGTPFEVEHEREFVAGPGVTTLRAVDPASGAESAVGANLLPTDEGNALIHVGAANLASFLRRAARRFDAEAGARPRGCEDQAAAPSRETLAAAEDVERSKPPKARGIA